MFADLMLQSPFLTRQRITLAYTVAVTADVIQWLLGPFGWFAVDEIVDVAAMIVITRAIGFHPLLLPTFVLELVPLADLLPTWTGCVAAVVMFRRRQPVRDEHPPGSVIDA